MDVLTRNNIIFWVVIGLFCGFLFLGIGVLLQLSFVLGKNLVTPLTPEEVLHLISYAVQIGPLLFLLGFLLSPILVCLGKARMGF